MQVNIEWEGRAWAVDTEEVTLAQAFVIKDTTKDVSWPSGRPLQPWLAGVQAGDPGCLRGLYWLMLQQDGQHRTIADLEFPVMRYHTAWVLASNFDTATAEQLRLILAEIEKQAAPIRAALPAAEAREAAEAEAAAQDAARPTRLTATESRPSSGHVSRTHQTSSAAQPAGVPAT